MKADVLSDARGAGGVRVARATARMAVLAAIRRRFAAESPLAGHRVALCGHITAETAVQAGTLTDLGAELVWCASSTSTTDEEVAALLRGSGTAVHGWRGMSEADLRDGARRALLTWPEGPTLVLDEGALLIGALHDELAGLPAPALGTEKTPDGLALLAGRPRLRFPVIKSDESFGKDTVDNPHGTAQSLVETITTVSGTLLAGKVVVVAGYGRVGAGVAAKARGSGGRVVVTEVDPLRALLAVLDGFEVLPMTEAVAIGDVVCTVTGAPHVLRREHFALLKDGVVLANGGHRPWEIDLDALHEVTTRRDASPPGVEVLDFADGRSAELVGGGHIANLSAGRGNASEVMDVTFAAQVLALVLALPGVSGLAPGLHPLPPACDDYVASALAEAMGIEQEDAADA
jgi:adenosylhomocysteinase